MQFFNKLKGYFSTQEAPKAQPALNSSIEVIIDDILDQPSKDFQLLGTSWDFEQFQRQENPIQLVQSMYVKGFLLIGDRCEGRPLTIAEWQQVIQQQNLSLFSKKDIYFSIFKGVDFTIRKDVWQLLAHTSAMKKMTNLSFEQLADPNTLPKGEIQMIDKDVTRTNAVTNHLPELRSILIAYVNLTNRSYIQGMNLIGGVLLRLLSLQNDKALSGHTVVEQEYAQRVFWVLVGVMKWKQWQQVFSINLQGLQRMLGELRQLMKEHVPAILARIQDLCWDMGIFAQYYVTICLYNCPMELAPMVLDLFLLDGQMIVHSLLIRMMVVNCDTIMGFADESQLMKFLKTDMLYQTYQTLLKEKQKAHKLQDFTINFLKSC